jgi:hypothetical protein
LDSSSNPNNPEQPTELVAAEALSSALSSSSSGR